jgi:hypothetical protein
LFVILIVFCQCLGVLFKFVINIGYVPIYLSLVVVVFLAVLCPQFGTISGYKFSADQVKMPGNLNSCSEDFFNSFRVVSSEIGDCVELNPTPEKGAG